MAGAFAGSFADAFGRSFAAGQQQKTLAQELGMRQEEARLRREERTQDLEFRGQEFEFRKRQQGALEKHQAYSHQLQERQMQVEARQQDLQTLDTMFKVLDSSLPKPVRQYILREFAPSLGIDPKGEGFKNIEKLVGALDPDSLKGMKDTILALMPKMEPGKATAFAKGVLEGHIKIEDIIKMQSEADKTSAIQNAFGAEESAPPDSSPTSVPTPGLSPPSDGGAPMPMGVEESMSGGKTADQWADTARELFQKGLNEEGRSALQLSSALRKGEANTEPTEKVVDPETGKIIHVTRTEAVRRRMEAAPPAAMVVDPARAERVKLDFERGKALIERAAVSKRLHRASQEFDVALKSGRFTPGAASGVRYTLGRWAEFFGTSLEDLGLGPNDPATAEIMDSAAQKMGLEAADSMSRLTNMSLEFVQRAYPSLMKTAAGNEIAIDLLQRAADLDVAVANVVEDYLSEHGDLRPLKPGVPSAFQKIKELEDRAVIDDATRAKIEKAVREGEGISFEKVLEQDRAEEGGKPRSIVVGTDRAQKTFETLGKTSEGFDQIDTEVLGKRMKVPVIWSEEGARTLKPGASFMWGPDGKVRIRR